MKTKKKYKVAFLDRDGVLNKNNLNNGYIGKIKDFKWINGAKKTIKFLNKENYKIVIVSNQSGVARNYFSINDVKKLHSHMKNELEKSNAKIDAIFFCPYHVDGVIKKYAKKSILRKPDIGMFKLAQKRFTINKKLSIMIGDQKTDMLFAKKSGIKGYLFNEKNLYLFLRKKLKKI